MLSFLALMLLAMVCFGGMVATILLLIFPKTRQAGVALLIVGSIGSVVMIGMLSIHYMQAGRQEQEATISRAEVAGEAYARDAQRSAARARAGSVLKTESGRWLPTPAEPLAPEASNPIDPTPEPTDLSPVDEAVPTTTGDPLSIDIAVPADTRPGWVDAPRWDPNYDVYQKVVSVGPYLTREECEQALPDEFDRAVADYIAGQWGPNAALNVSLPAEHVRKRMIYGEWVETIQNPLDPSMRELLGPGSQGPMMRLYMLVQFDRNANELIQEQWRQVVVVDRLWYIGTVVAMLLALLAIAYVLLRVDTTTAGACRGRLAFGAVVAALVVAAGAYGMAVALGAPLEVEDTNADAEARLDPTPGRISATAESPGDAAQPFWANFRLSVGPMEVIISAVVAVYVLVLTVLSRARWAWCLGFIACFALAAAVTPADPLTLLLIAVPMCGLYTVAVFAYKAPRESVPTATEG